MSEADSRALKGMESYSDSYVRSLAKDKGYRARKIRGTSRWQLDDLGKDGAPVAVPGTERVIFLKVELLAFLRGQLNVKNK